MAQQQIELWSSISQRSEWEDLADLYAILRTTEMLETAYARDALESAEYRDAASKLIQQFKATEKALVQRGTIESLSQFVRKYNVDCPRAVERMTLGAVDSSAGPSGSSSTNTNGDKKSHLALVRDITELFITTSNLVFLERTAADDLTPQLEALLKTLTKAKQTGMIPSDFEASALETWLKTLQQRRASERLDEDETRQFVYDLNNAKSQIDDLLSQA